MPQFIVKNNRPNIINLLIKLVVLLPVYLKLLVFQLGDWLIVFSYILNLKITLSLSEHTKILNIMIFYPWFSTTVISSVIST